MIFVILALGRCEIDDVIMNTIGVAIGALAYKISGTCKKPAEKKN